MRGVCIFALFVAATAHSQTIYYATITGENSAKKIWHKSSLEAYKAAPPDDVYDSYTVERRRDGTSVVHRDYTTPSGDWRFELTYEYGRDRRLRRLHSEFITFGGISMPDAGGGLTRFIRTFTVTPAGTLRQTHERIIDEKTGRNVARTSYTPQVDHWMTLDALPMRPNET